MIMQRQADGSYSHIGFIKTSTEEIEQVVDKNGDLYFEQGYNRETSGYPLTLTDGIGKPLSDYKIYGNIMQNGTPTPEAPVEVLGCGDRTRNLAVVENKTSASRGVTLTIKDGVCTLKGTGTENGGRTELTTASHPFLLKSGTYILSSTNYGRVFVTDVSNNKAFPSGAPFTITEDRMIVIGFNILKDETYDIQNIHIQLELGSEATSYVPYGYEIPVVSRGKNLLKLTNGSILKNNVSVEITDGSVTLNGVTSSSAYEDVWTLYNGINRVANYPLYTQINEQNSFLLKSGKYIFNYEGAQDRTIKLIIGGIGQDANSGNAILISKGEIFTIEEEKFCMPIANSVKDISSATAFNIQLELGSTATEYEPYHEPITTTITLPQPLFKGDYLTKDKSGGKVHRAWGVKVFDGTEKWTNSYGINLFNIQNGLKDIPFAVAKSFCSHYIYNGVQSGINDATKNGEFALQRSEDENNYVGYSVFFKDARFTNVTDFKSFLASEYAKGTPVTVYYPLATPTEESIDLPDIPTIDGTTIIETDTELSPLSIEATYKAKKSTVYGYHINPNVEDSFNAVTYLEDAVGMTPAKMGTDSFDYGSWQDAFFIPKPCMLKYDGTVAYYLDPNDYSRKLDGTPSDIANPDFEGNAMMEWGLIWYKFAGGTEDGEGYFYVSDHRVDDSYHCWCNFDCDDNIIPHFYTAIYNSTLHNGKFRSLSGLALTKENGSGYTTGAQEIAYCTANNTTDTVEWYTDIYADRELINALHILVSKSKNTQSSFGRGLDTGGGAAKNAYVTGTLNNKGLFYGVTANGNSAVKTFGMENWWGCAWHRTAGCIVSAHDYKVKLTYGTADGTTESGYNSTGNGYISTGTTPSANGYIKKFKYDEHGYMPFEAGGSASTYYADYYYQNTGTYYLLVGGRSGDGTDAGAFYFNLGNAFSNSGWGVSAALSCKPLALKG